MDADLVDLLANGATLVTPNRRLAADLARRYATACRAAGATVWRTADILPLSAWLQRSLQRILRDDARMQCLAPVQEQVLWQRVLSEHADAFPLVDIPAAARLARDAHGLALAWRLPLVGRAASVSDDGAAFLRWRARFHRRCEDEGWIDGPHGLDLLIEAAGRAALPCADALIAYGFDALSVQQRELLDALRRRGAAVHVARPDAVPGSVSVAACDDQSDEWQQVAHAVRAVLEAQPSASVGIVVPTLAQERAKVMRIFDDVLDPGRATRFDRGPRPYNVSAGAPLSAHPLVHAALCVLRLAAGAIAWDELGSLLRSPFLADAQSERSARAALDAHLRRLGMLELDAARLADIVHRVRPDAPHACPRLTQRLAAWLEQRRQAVRARRSPSAWGAQVATLLTGLGWPGERSLDSEEHQTLEKWHALLGELAHLDAVLGAIEFPALCAQLTRLASDTTFQPESSACNVQILGVLESAGLRFDHLFVTGMHAEAWPQAARPNPFLPVELQRAHEVPHASAQWELAFAQRMLSSWSGAATQVRFTCASRDGDRRLRPSPLLRAFDVAPMPGRGIGHAKRIFSAARIEQIDEGDALPVAPRWNVAVGSALFANQAACPFRAFVMHRLGAQPLEDPVPGLDARRRGSLLHDALHRLWQRWQTQAHLAALPVERVDADITATVDAALDALQRQRPDLVTSAFRALERVRLRRLIEQLVVLERQRAPFTVEGSEVRHDASFAGLQLNLRIDRVDRLDDGRLVVLDYKTGRTGVGNWYGERPEDPQLPLYAVLQTQPVAGLAFVSLRAEGVAFKGLGEDGGLLPGVPTPDAEQCGTADWQALLGGWRGTLERLASAFLEGVVRVDPKRFPATCQYCPLDAMCRVRELLDGAVADDDGGQDA